MAEETAATPILDVRILIPTSQGSRFKEFMASLVSMLYYLQWVEPKTKDGKLIHATPILFESSVLPSARRQLVELGQKPVLVLGQQTSAQWFLWLDDDMEFPANALNKLLAHDKDIVGANYTTKVLPNVRPTAQVRRSENCFTFPDSTGLEKVQRMGFGLVLMKASVFDKLPQPWFEMRMNMDTGNYIGEDTTFFDQVAKCKPEVGVFVDHDLSRKVAHWGKLPYTHGLIRPPERKKVPVLFMPNGAKA